MSTVLAPALPKTEEKNVKEGLQKALDLLRSEGWTQRVAKESNYPQWGHSRCALGAIWAVMDEDPIYYIQMALQILETIGAKPGKDFVWTYRSGSGRERSILSPDVSPVAEWNDAPERTFEAVETVFEHTIEKMEAELA